ncbi:cache domain-containing protein [Spirochaeta isovalerica]|uniref:histidine kinase n=1 Tax=Spirochaeta isovalerica TaxID=150 RepID=A0A841R8Q4_9SPIO|nr:cache domain-containing protein [Spirochaeta isovalerica]MBB6479339.1 PAS domain S-box-containing protein [Spirochaeta isovalerica]
MAKRTYSLINGILLLFVSALLLLAAIFLVIQFNTFNNRYKKEALLLQTKYTESQKEQIKREVMWVSDFIYSNLDSLEEQVGETVRMRTYEAYSVAEHIYNTNRGKISNSEIQERIRQALRPVRYSGGLGYVFISSFSGNEILFPDKPELEGQNLIDMKTADGKYLIRDMIAISRDQGEGFYSYSWTKPGDEGSDHKKISYIKRFEPYDWIIGTGLYLSDEEAALKNKLLIKISNIRFGKEGYIFVNSMEGDALVSNGELMTGDRKLWEVFSSNPERSRDLFRMEYEAALKPEGDYIYYTIRKLSDSTVESPKASFIIGIPEFDWLIGAGVYLDDVDKEIAQLREISYIELRGDIVDTIIITLSIISLFFLFLFLADKRLKKEFNLFSSFFESSLTDDLQLNLDSFYFRELAELAGQANGMQRDKAEALSRLRESENRFRLLAENSRDMIFKMSFPGGNFEYISPAAIDVLGYTAQEIMEEPYHVRKTIHPDWRDWLEGVFDDINSGHIDETFEYPIISKSGEERWISQKNTLIKGEEEGTYVLIGRLSDETRRKKAEEDLNRNNRMEAIGKLAGGVAHDFNNVLAGIMNAANVLKSPRREIDEKGLKMADLILKAASRAADLTAKLSAFGGKRALFLKPQNVHHILEETEVILSRTIDMRIAIQMNLNAAKSVILADGTEIQSIILNLGINASHAIEGSGSIHINTENMTFDEKDCTDYPFECHPGDYVRIEILDTGSGMDEETLKHIFEPFFSTKEKGKGSGLGLATVYKSVHDHKGMIQVTSEVGEGTSFILLFPCIDEKPDETPVPAESTGLRSGTILLVDDEEFIRETGRGILEESGYTVITASNGREALDIFRERKQEIDLVILDVIMPELNGVEAFYKIREIREDCPIIMITGFSRDPDLSKLKEKGVSCIIRKPFEQSLFKKEIDMALQKKTGKQ